jgi:hypothetical protein
VAVLADPALAAGFRRSRAPVGQSGGQLPSSPTQDARRQPGVSTSSVDARRWPEPSRCARHSGEAQPSSSTQGRPLRWKSGPSAVREDGQAGARERDRRKQAGGPAHVAPEDCWSRGALAYGRTLPDLSTRGEGLGPPGPHSRPRTPA